MKPIAVVFVMLVGCFSSDDTRDVVGPYTGEVQRYVVDRFVLPMANEEARQLADDLDGNGSVENQLGSCIAALGGLGGNLSAHGDDLIASGVIASVVEIQADDLASDDTVSVRYLGADTDPATETGGTLEDGVYRSNRTRTTRVPGRAVLRLPIFRDASPSVVTLHGVQIDLAPDGNGGYDGIVRGYVLGSEALDETARGLIEMIVNDPQDHPDAVRLLDRDRDGTITLEEVTTSSLISALLAPDLVVRVDGASTKALSFGFGIHLAPCPSGRCAEPPDDLCFDGIVDGDESDADCGGGCRACAGGDACGDPADCQSGRCTQGTCEAPSCVDGLANGMETDVDCGWNCGGCARGQQCETNGDCTSGVCEVSGTCR